MPALRAADVKRSEAFYGEKLGFRSDGTDRHGAAYIYVENAGALCAAWRRNGVDIVRDPEDMPYGPRDFDIRDPDGHPLAFGHDPAPGEVEPGLVNGDHGSG